MPEGAQPIKDCNSCPRSSGENAIEAAYLNEQEESSCPDE